MTTELANTLQAYPEIPLTRQLLLDALRKYKRPNDKIAELIKGHWLMPLKKGLYVPGKKLRQTPPEPLLIANHLRGPSYISLETALAYWGLIPEQVHEIASVTTKGAKNFQTAVGRFSYLHAPLPYYAFGIKNVRLSQRQSVLMASPEKALCDKMVMTPGLLLRSVRQTGQLLFEDLRLDEQQVANLDHEVMGTWINDAPKKKNLQFLVKAIAAL